MEPVGRYVVTGMPAVRTESALNASAKESYRASMFWRPYCDLAWSGPDQ